MIYITNLDKPGFIGKFSSTLGEAGINIATFHVGRDAPGGNAVALIEIDGELPESVLPKCARYPRCSRRSRCASENRTENQAIADIVRRLPPGGASFIRRWTWPVAPGFKCPGASAGKGS